MGHRGRIVARVRQTVFRGARRLSLRAAIWGCKPYQPVGDLKSPDCRRPASAFEARWEAIAQAASGTDMRSFLDVGSAEGYFVRRAARELGLFALGVEGNWGRVSMGTALAELSNDRGYGFAYGVFTPADIRRLPIFDIVVCLSVLHHVIRRSDREGGIDFLKALGSITGKRFIFDMGGPGETSHSWAKQLGFLSGDVNARIAEYLHEAGFSDVQIVGESFGHRDPVTRAIFSCAPPANVPFPA